MDDYDLEDTKDTRDETKARNRTRLMRARNERMFGKVCSLGKRGRERTVLMTARLSKVSFV
jgi:hypothetical protein